MSTITASPDRAQREPTALDIQILQEIAHGTAGSTGDQFLSSLVAHLARALDVAYAFIAVFDAENQGRLRIIASSLRGKQGDPFDYPAIETPCQTVSAGQSCFVPEKLRERYPASGMLQDLHVESYFGVPLIAPDGHQIGNLAVMHTEPMESEPLATVLLTIFANRVVAELDRLTRERALVASEERFRELFDAAPICYVTVNPAGYITQANQSAARMFRRPVEALLGMHVYALHPDTPEGLGRSKNVLGRFQRGEDIVDEEIQLLRADGAIGWAALTVHAVRDDAGQIIASRSVMVDTTERRLAALALRQSEEKFRRILSSAMDAIIAIDADGRIMLFNEAAERTFKCSAAAVMGESIDRLVSEELAEFIRDYYQRSGKTRHDGYVWAPSGLKARRYDDEEFPIEATFSRVELDTQTLHTIILRDVNDRNTANLQIQKLQSVTNYLREELESEQHYREIVGSSDAIMKVLDSVERVANTDAGILILGETGTGKELIARAIHQASGRRDRPLIKVNCAAIPRTLVESELFGHEKGAFTGANRTKIGRFELADGGTIFLDEIGEIPPFVQVKLLRVLQERSVERLGGTESKPINVRVIAATNRDLHTEVQAGRFRADLYFRLNVFPIRVPSLRERPEDIPQLAMHFVQLYEQRFSRKIDGIDPDSMQSLVAYPWPGNIRELENIVERAVILNSDGILRVPFESLNPQIGRSMQMAPATQMRATDDYGDEVGPPPIPPPQAAVPGSVPSVPSRRSSPAIPSSSTPQVAPGPVTLEEVERQHIINVLSETDWVIGGDHGAAKVLDLHPNTLRSRMKKLGIQKPKT